MKAVIEQNKNIRFYGSISKKNAIFVSIIDKRKEPYNGYHSIKYQ